MNRAESILNAVTGALTGLATTGVNVQRSRTFPSLALPALTVAMGSNDVQQDNEFESDLDELSRQLQINITAHQRAGSSMETVFNQIAAEIYAALTADRSHGLGYVLDTRLQGDSEPDISSAPTVSQRMTWLVHYQHSNTSTEV